MDCELIRDRYFGPGDARTPGPELQAHLDACTKCRKAWAAMSLVDRALADLPRASIEPPPFDAIADAVRGVAQTRRRVVAVRRSFPFVYTGVASALAAAAIALFFFARPAIKVLLLNPGASIEAHAQSQSVRLESGARVRLETGAVALAPKTKETKGEERLHLKTGLVTVEVPKLPADRKLVVSTSEADVIVHGTRFQVRRDGEGTSVDVVDGLVEVRPRNGQPPVFLHPGENTSVQSTEYWHKGLRERASAAIERGDFAAAEDQLAPVLASETDPLRMAETQALMAWSLAAAGKRAAAVEAYRKAMNTLPVGERPLWADNAAAELALLLEQQKPEEAAAAWRAYLDRFAEGLHAGFARARLRQ
jgi:ferric-dicitrate binding protein FerR (iron transport regulator)